MKVGIIGSGGREHAICHAIKQSDKVKKIYCFPGNAGTSEIATNVELNINDFTLLLNFIKENKGNHKLPLNGWGSRLSSTTLFAGLKLGLLF